MPVRASLGLEPDAQSVWPIETGRHHDLLDGVARDVSEDLEIPWIDRPHQERPSA